MFVGIVLPNMIVTSMEMQIWSRSGEAPEYEQRATMTYKQE